MNKGSYRVAALVSLYKAERFIRGRLEDLISQTLFKRGELEVIVVDSASPEGEFEIVREYLERYPDIHYTRTEERETLYKAWNRGIEISSAPYLANANADDRYRADALEKLAEALDSDQGAGFAYGDAYLSTVENETFEEVAKTRVYRSQDYFGPDLLCHQFLGHQVMWRRSLHDNTGLFDPDLKAAGDYEFMLRGAMGGRGVHVKEPLGLLLRRSDSITFSDGTMNREVVAVKEQYRNPDYALELYRVEGVDIEKPGYSEACYVDLGNRALAYFPQWGGGRPDADFEFAQRCYGWARDTRSDCAAAKSVKKMAEVNARSARMLSGEEETAEGLPKTGRGPSSSVAPFRETIALHWPELGGVDPSELRRQVLGRPAVEGRDGAGEIQDWLSHVSLLEYWARLTSLDLETVESWRLQVEPKQTVMVWGASARGVLLSRMLCQFGLNVAAFIDNDPTKAGGRKGGLPVFAFDPSLARDHECKVVLAVSDQQRGFVLDQLEACDARGILLDDGRSQPSCNQ